MNNKWRKKGKTKKWATSNENQQLADKNNSTKENKYW